ncbi:Uncharacterised protein [Escherichia coli]|nr:Uncharacterised protein [Escherichia coli]
MPLYEWLINKRLRYQYITLLAFSILALLALGDAANLLI